ncbi:MAG: biopolymer transporter ExbD [Planctomycetia bacterium]|nr:biopolymer transporter ExbD [Planctomycetia bacterium]
MSRRRKRRRSENAVELNLAAMLDMAFQLLTFFILTFRPVPVEGQISLRMPPAQPVTPVRNAVQAGSDAANENPVQGLDSLVISVIPNAAGGISSMAIGEGVVATLTGLNDRLKTVLSDQASPFDQVVIQVGPVLRYDALMGVVDVCTRQRLPTGQKLTKLSFVELPDARTQ